MPKKAIFLLHNIIMRQKCRRTRQREHKNCFFLSFPHLYDYVRCEGPRRLLLHVAPQVVEGQVQPELEAVADGQGARVGTALPVHLAGEDLAVKCVCEKWEIIILF